MGRPPGSDRAANLHKILDAALSSFADKGYAGTHFADIGDRAGFSRSALYQYFPNKKELYLALLRNIQKEHTAGVEQIMRGDNIFEEKLQDILAIFVTDHEFDFNRSTFLAAVPVEHKRHPELVEGHQLDDTVPGLLLKFFAQAIDEKVITSDFNPEDLLVAFLGGLLGMSLFQHSTGLGSMGKANEVTVAMLTNRFLMK